MLCQQLFVEVQGASEEQVAAMGAAGPEDPQPLSEEEVAEKEELLGSGFSTWNRRDFSAFTRACEKARAPGFANARQWLVGHTGSEFGTWICAFQWCS